MDIKVETLIKLNKIKLRDYQLPIQDAIENKNYRKVVAIMPRRSGKDITAFFLAIRQCIRRVCVVYYIFPTYSQGRKILWDSITNDGQRILHLIPDELIASTNSSEMKIRFTNGSLLQVVGSDNFDGLVGTNPQMCIFSEYALQDPRAYQFLRPILTGNDGIALFISCVSPDTLVLTDKGLSRIKDISDSRKEYSDLNKQVYGIGGFHNAEQFYYGGKQKTLKIKLESGYELECTPIHPIWNGKEWIKSQDLKTGDLIPIQYGQDVWGEGLDVSGYSYNSIHKHLKDPIMGYDNDDFFYLLGLIHTDGNYDKNKVCVTKKKDQAIIDFLNSYGFITRPDGIHHEYNSRVLCGLLKYLDFKHGARNKTFPDKLFACKKRQMKSFIQGLFDGDGCSDTNPVKRGRIKLTSTCLEFIQDLQVVLLNFGIVSSIRHEDKAPTKLVKVWSRIYNLEITSYFANIFYRDIGFRLERKQKNWTNIPIGCRKESGNIYPIDLNRLEGYSLPKNIVENKERISRRLIKFLNNRNQHLYLEECLSNKFFYSPVKEITNSESEVFDFVIPNTFSFFSGGLLSHNTPRGKNHLWEMYNIACDSDNWFAYKLSVNETGHISLNDIEREKAEGIMSEDLIQQEYFCSFELGVEGSYYAKYIDRMRLRSQIGCVPWEVGFKVHTAWDLGVRDSTCIIFFQIIGQTIRIIDYYEKNKEGLEHYINVINSKPYSYGKHFAPHDIQVREFTSGVTRIDKARQLGVSFTIADNISIMDGIEAVRSAFGKIWIDEVACKDLIKALENYRQEFDTKRKIYKSNPLHNWASHACFVGDTRILTRSGMRPIMNIRKNTQVLTLSGWKKCLKAKKTKKNVNVVEVMFQDGTKVRCTPDHLFLTENGWRSAKDLLPNTEIRSSLTSLHNILMGAYTEYGQMKDTILEAAINYTEMPGDLLLVKYHQTVISIIETTRQIITICGISNALLKKNILDNLALITKDLRKLLLIKQPNGIVQRLEKFGTVDMLEHVLLGLNGTESIGYVCTAKKNLTVLLEKMEMDRSFVIPIVKLPVIERVNLLDEKIDVWDITVPGEGNFSLENTAVVHNSDAMRYLCVSLPKTRDGASPAELNKRYEEAMYGTNKPGGFFSDDQPY